MSKVITLKFDNRVQMDSFFCIINSKFGLSIYDLMSKTNYPKTTLIDNLRKIRFRDYIDTYRLPTGKRGRPKTIFESDVLMKKRLSKEFFSIELSEVILQ